MFRQLILQKGFIMSHSGKFSAPMRTIHWSMAALIIGMLAFGIYVSGVPLDDPDKFNLYDWHRAFGVLAFLMVIIRLVVRFRSIVPDIPTSIPWYQRRAALGAQILLYTAILAMPISGYIASSAVPDFPGIPPVHNIWFFGLELPIAPIEKKYETTQFYMSAHKWVGYSMIAIIVAHAAGALKHRLFDKPENDVLSKML